MDPRPALHELAVRYSLPRADADALQRLAEREPEPSQLQHTLPLGIAILAAALGGLGIIFWVAANWDTLGRSGKFALLQSLIVVMCGGTLLRPKARPALGLLALLAIGGLFAFFGQTYQTGADTWQLFALWTVLSLPLCLAVRHDALWAPWTLVAMTAITLCLHAHIGYAWQPRSGDQPYHLMTWLAAFLLILAMSPLLKRYTGAGPWAMRTALTLTALLLTSTAVNFLFDRTGAELLYYLALALTGAMARAFCTPRLHDTFALSALGLSLNVLLVALLAHLLFEGGHGDRIPELTFIGLAAAALLAGTVSVVLKQVRMHAPGDQP